jgi:AcrR family transcriptional regulator
LGRRTQAERSSATTAELIESARRLFGRDGYAATSIDDIARASGMTKGAVYHHFAGKEVLFRAVFVREEEHLTEVIAAAAERAADPWDRVLRGVRAFLRACLDPQVQRIVLLDGPAVLGWDTVRAIEYDHTLEILRAGLSLATAGGRRSHGDITTRSHLIFGALCEAGMLIARADDPAATLSRVLGPVEELLTSLAGA